MKQQYKTDGPESPDGTLWWHLKLTPGTKWQPYGGEKRLAAYLYFEAEVGDRFTMRELREGLGTDGVADDAEQLNRRLRALRPDDWIIRSYKDDHSLPPNTYRLEAVGTRVWLGERNPRDKVSKLTEKVVIERDGRRCVVCGVGAGEEYPGEPGSFARMTIGHRVPGARRGGASPDDLQTECAHHNEAARDVLPDPEDFDEVLPAVRALKRAELRDVRNWMAAGRRSRSKLDLAYDRVLKLRPSEKERMLEAIDDIIGDE
ncbi:HNH endonuclease [Angustibacter luteus]|uniref:HNH endonuclease n=1 Tax=Angustibacter luteus TaxID=658456 RepID=A0ABW1JDM1_9ACTN